MLAYYGYTISPNQIETGEGFLICRNVPIARVGDQEYLGQEIGLTGADAARVVTVHRAPEEVFSEAAMASFNGKPVTNDHPPCLIGPDDASVYEKGHAQAIRKGEGEWADYVLADIHIHDRALIDAVRNGKREISCGYECEYVSNGDGTYSQLNIRGNHVAVVDRGRAGKRAAILDSGTNKEQAGRPERKAMKKKGLLFKLFGQAVKDKSPEEIEQLAMDAAEALDAEEEEGKETSKTAAEGGKEKEGGQEGGSAAVKDEDSLAALIEKLVDKRMAEKQQAVETKDDIGQAIERLEKEESQDGHKNSGAADDGTLKAQAAQGPASEEKATVMDKALASGILKAMRPSVAAIKDEAQRKAVSDALLSLVAAKDGQDDIAAILKAGQANARHMAGNKPAAMDTDAIQAMYDNLNPHRKKEEK